MPVTVSRFQLSSRNQGKWKDHEQDQESAFTPGVFCPYLPGSEQNDQRKRQEQGAGNPR